MKLHRDIGVTQNTAWRMSHRIREAWKRTDRAPFVGLEKNKRASDKLRAGRGTAGKTPVAGMRDRTTNQIGAEVVDRANKPALQKFVYSRAGADATIYTDEAAARKDIDRERESVKRNVGERVRGMAPANGLEPFLADAPARFRGRRRANAENALIFPVASPHTPAALFYPNAAHDNM